MAVPKMSQLRKGAGVRIVLKSDQRTGKLTTGNIADILTRGDHPRGIKVRLADGRIGRVQSFAPSYEGAGTAGTVGGGVGVVDGRPETGEANDETSSLRRRGGRRAPAPYYDDRADGAPAEESLSLLDYVRVPPSNLKARRTAADFEATAADRGAMVTIQEQLESEFPKLDTALISAIMVDYPEVADARTVLSSLS